MQIEAHLTRFGTWPTYESIPRQEEKAKCGPNYSHRGFEVEVVACAFEDASESLTCFDLEDHRGRGVDVLVNANYEHFVFVRHRYRKFRKGG